MKTIAAEPIAIFLNGPSSAGKSTLAAALQEKLLPTPYLHIGIDRIIDMMPLSMNDWRGGKVDQGFWWKLSKDEEGHTLANIQAGPYAEKINSSLRNVVVTLLNDGHNLIIDEVCLYEQGMNAWRQKLDGFTTIFVALSASTETLEQRERERGDRMPGSARALALDNLAHEKTKYDLVIDTGQYSTDVCAEMIIEHTIIKYNLEQL